MKSAFTKTFFTANRAHLRAHLSMDYPVILTANGTLQRTADTSYPFQQESNFWYLTGIDAPDITVVLHPTHEYLILPETTSIKAVFDGALDLDELKNRSGITQLYDSKEGWNKLTDDLRRTKKIYTLALERRFQPNARVYANPAQRHFIEKLQRRVPGIGLTAIDEDLASLRMHKQPEELSAIEAAVRITTDTIAQVRKSSELLKLQTEYALEAAISYGFRTRGASGHAYAPIVASGAHAATLHYVSNTGILGKNELIVADVGAEVEHYAADITRTFSAQKPSARQQDIVDAVRNIQQRAVALLRPGTVLRDYERTVAKYTGEALYDLGLITNKNDIYAIRTYFPHASSHFLGLDVHDSGEYDTPLEPSVVLTCEPGIYIPEEGIGVRIEDDIVITETGNRNISIDCSYDAYAI